MREDRVRLASPGEGVDRLEPRLHAKGEKPFPPPDVVGGADQVEVRIDAEHLLTRRRPDDRLLPDRSIDRTLCPKQQAPLGMDAIVVDRVVAILPDLELHGLGRRSSNQRLLVAAARDATTIRVDRGRGGSRRPAPRPSPRPCGTLRGHEGSIRVGDLKRAPWRESTPEEAADWLRRVPCRWWLAGGWAIERFVGSA